MRAAKRRHGRLLGCVLLAACGSETTFQGRDNRETGAPDFDDSRSDSDAEPEAVCSAKPNPASPGKRVDFFGEGSFDPDGIPISSYRWKLIQKPDLSRTTMPLGDANRLGMIPDYVGNYGATLEVVNERGTISQPCSVGLTVRPEDGLYIEAETSVQQADDIQVVLTLNGGPMCAPGNCPGFGGSAGGPDDPVFRFENLAQKDQLVAVGVPTPASGTYEVALRDGNRALSLGDNEITVRVFVNGNVKWSGKHTFTKEPGYPGVTADPVPLANVSWPSGSVQAIAAP